MNVILMSGISGAGKDTWLSARFDMEALADESNRPDAVIVSADDYFMRDGVYTFSPSLLPAAHGKCLRDFVEVVSTPACFHDSLPKHLVVNNTNLSTEELAPYVALASAYGFPIELVTIHVEPHIAAARSLHVNAINVLKSMHDRLMARKLPPFWSVKQTDVKPHNGHGGGQIG